VIAVVGYNDAFVMSAWSKANGIKNDEILFLSDDEAKFSKSIGWTMGLRLARYAIVLDKGKVVYCGKDEPGKLEVCMRVRGGDEANWDRRVRRRQCWRSCRMGSARDMELLLEMEHAGSECIGTAMGQGVIAMACWQYQMLLFL